MRKFAYFKLCQAVLTSVFLWQILSTHQFCGEFDEPTAFFNSAVSSSSAGGHCDQQFTLIGMDSTTGEYGAVPDKQKWHMQLMASSGGGQGQPIDEQQQQQKNQMEEFSSKLPTVGRHCIPIAFSLVNPWLHDNKSHLQKVVDLFAIQLLCGVLSLFVIAIHVLDQPRSWGYESIDYERTMFCAVLWSCPALVSSVLLLHWTSYWHCTNFRADSTNVPLITLILSIVLMCSSLAEICFNSSLVAKRSRRGANAASTAIQQQNEVTTEHANAAAQQKNGSAIVNVPPVNAVVHCQQKNASAIASLPTPCQQKNGSAVAAVPTHNAVAQQKNGSAVAAVPTHNAVAQQKNGSAVMRT